MNVSIIIVNYNTKELTKNCIDSILEKTHGIEYEIILIDNASSDGSKDFFSQNKDIHFIPNQKNIGFGRANNIGIKVAKGKYIFLLNSDTYLLNNAIKEFFDYMENCSNNIAVAGTYLKDKNLKDNTSEVHYLYIGKILRNTIKPFLLQITKRNKIKVDKSDIQNDKFVEAVIGADMFIRKEAITQCGMFDENIFMYCEEIDLQKRFTDNGYKIKLITTPKIVHLEGSSSKKYSAQRNIMFMSGCFYYLRKHNPLWKYITFRILYFILKLPILFNNQYTFNDRIRIIYNNLTSR